MRSIALEILGLRACPSRWFLECPPLSSIGMSASQKPRPTEEELWGQLCDLPETLKGEIIDGELFVQPRPRFRHARINRQLGQYLGPLDGDPRDPAGWWILSEPGIELPGAREFAPDMGGWRRTTMPEPPALGCSITVTPDWVCEVLSPSNARYDLTRKMPFYARVGVPWLWLVDPQAQTLQVWSLNSERRWTLLVTCSEEALARLPPFEEVELPVSSFWL